MDEVHGASKYIMVTGIYSTNIHSVIPAKDPAPEKHPSTAIPLAWADG